MFAAVPIGAAAAVVLGSASKATAAPSVTQSLTSAITQAVPSQSLLPGGGNFVGTMTLTSVANPTTTNGALTAVVTLVGSILDAAGNLVQSISQTLQVPLSVSGSCQILTLTLGPLHLDLLGLVVDLNQVTLTITAVPGAGNLLGNLLCAVANLLNGLNGGALSGVLTQLQNLLTQILGAL